MPPSVVGMKITQAPGLRNIKTASGKISPRCFRWLLHKRHANPTRELVSGAEQAEGLSKIAIWNLLLAARAALGHIRPQRSCGRVAEGGGLLNLVEVYSPVPRRTASPDLVGLFESPARLLILSCLH